MNRGNISLFHLFYYVKNEYEIYILDIGEILKFIQVSVKFAEIRKLVLCLDFQIRQNQKNKLKEKNDEYELKNMSYKNTRKYNYVSIKKRR